MQAKRLLQQAPFDQPTVQMLCRVLDEGWTSIATGLDGATEIAVRKNLADAILAMARLVIAIRLSCGNMQSRALALLGHADRRPQRPASRS